MPESMLWLMCWQCDHPNATVDDYLAELRRMMSEHGWAVQYVGGGRGRWPWAASFSDGRGRQPVLGARKTQKA